MNDERKKIYHDSRNGGFLNLNFANAKDKKNRLDDDMVPQGAGLNDSDIMAPLVPLGESNPIRISDKSVSKSRKRKRKQRKKRKKPPKIKEVNENLEESNSKLSKEIILTFFRIFGYRERGWRSASRE